MDPHSGTTSAKPDTAVAAQSDTTAVAQPGTTAVQSGSTVVQRDLTAALQLLAQITPLSFRMDTPNTARTDDPVSFQIDGIKYNVPLTIQIDLTTLSAASSNPLLLVTPLCQAVDSVAAISDANARPTAAIDTLGDESETKSTGGPGEHHGEDHLPPVTAASSFHHTAPGSALQASGPLPALPARQA
ncbi:hypothetical protein B0T21DRAFT_414959 [Apiosordaria backusii]|uniref:Uncharacterized protein n=1 Tax=Apiosordaria backusii TaxID=314023 RepID=A0AA40DWH5_9PEZI|nr:hypothetical protein B0T21DRAFT_414959 [Apiosordaria backusii]